MGIGSLSWRIELDEPAKVHCGSTSIVKGSVVLRYTAAQAGVGAGELFGPMEVAIVLEGRAKSKIWKRSGEHTTIYRGRAPLVSLGSGIHNGSIKIQVARDHRLRFTVAFPETVQPNRMQPAWRSSADFDTSLSAPLPPSMNLAYHGFGHRFDCFVEYRIKAMVSMPSIDVKIAPIYEDHGPMVYYQPVRLSEVFAARHNTTPLKLIDSVEVKNKYLLPVEQRPTGFMQHAKNFFDSDAYPTFAYDCLLEGPAEVYLDQPINFTLSLRPNIPRSTAPELPTMKVINFNIQIKAQTEVRADSLIFERGSRGTEVAVYLAAKTQQNEDFSKANDFTKTYSTPVLAGLPTSFSTFNIFRAYIMSVTVVVETATKTRKFNRDYKVKILPPLIYSDHTPIAGSSQQIHEHSEAEAGPSTVAEQLPQYQAPPSYEQTKSKPDQVIQQTV